MTDLNWFPRTTNKTEERPNGAEEAEEDGNECSTGLGLSLEGCNRIDPCELDERERLGAEPFERVLLESLLDRGLLFHLLSLFRGHLDGVLDFERFCGESLGILLRVANVNVIEQDILGHGPDLEANTANLVEVRWCLINEVIDVLDLARLPHALVRWVVDQWRAPFALIVGIGLGRTSPFAATGCLLALRVRECRRDPVAILLVIPLRRLLGIGIRDNQWLVVKPTLGFDGLANPVSQSNCCCVVLGTNEDTNLVIRNRVRRFLIPIVGLPTLIKFNILPCQIRICVP